MIDKKGWKILIGISVVIFLLNIIATVSYSTYQTSPGVYASYYPNHLMINLNFGLIILATVIIPFWLIKKYGGENLFLGSIIVSAYNLFDIIMSVYVYPRFHSGYGCGAFCGMENIGLGIIDGILIVSGVIFLLYFKLKKD